MLSRVQLFATPWSVGHQAPLSMGFSRQEYWSGLPFPPPGYLPKPGSKPTSLASPALQVDSLPLYHLGSPITPLRPWILLMTWVTILWVPLTRHCTKLLIHSTSSHADSSCLPFSCKPLLSYQNFLMWSPFCLEIVSYFFFFLNFFHMCCFIYFWLCWVFIAAHVSL